MSSSESALRRVPTVLLLLVLLISCEIDYELAGGQDDEDQPDILMEGVTQIQSTQDFLVIVRADRASLYNKRGETLFEGLSFSEENLRGEVLRTGSAGTALVDDDNRIELTGGALIESLEDEILIRGESLVWNNETLLLESTQGEVSIVKEGEKEIRGSRFRADFDLNEIAFDGPVSGVVHIDD